MMRGFYYYIPSASLKKRTIDAPDVRLFGFGHALPGREGPQCIHTTTGPDGTGGMVVTFNVRGERLHPAFNTDQTWIPTDQAWYVGVNKAERPGPDDLARARVIEGHLVELLDGKRWELPICRSVVRGSTLPKRLSLNADGKSIARVELDEYVELCSKAEKFFGQFYAAMQAATAEQQSQSFEWDEVELYTTASEALGVNYRVSRWEVELLGLFSDEKMFEVLKAITDVPSIEAAGEALKKKQMAEASSVPAM